MLQENLNKLGLLYEQNTISIEGGCGTIYCLCLTRMDSCNSCGFGGLPALMFSL
jgi:hypothetical protein